MRRWFFLIGLSASSPAASYEFVFDLDTDGDPSTINTSTVDREAIAQLVIRPTEPDEIVRFAYAYSGYRCDFCAGATRNHHSIAYEPLPGFGGGLFDDGWDWDARVVECDTDPFYDRLFEGWSIEGALSEPTFVGPVRVYFHESPPPDRCQVPAGELIVWNPLADTIHRVEIGAEPVPAVSSSWARLKLRFEDEEN